MYKHLSKKKNWLVVILVSYDKISNFKLLKT